LGQASTASRKESALGRPATLRRKRSAVSNSRRQR
jgi:hypothetical protein